MRINPGFKNRFPCLPAQFLVLSCAFPICAAGLEPLNQFPALPRGWAYDVEVSGSLAYVANGQGGLLIVDVSDPATITEVGGVNTPGTARSLELSGDHLFVADDDAGMQVIQLQNATNAAVVANLPTVGSAIQVALENNLLAIAEGTNGVQLVDVSNPLGPTSHGTFDTPGTALGVALKESHAFVADGTNGLVILDITNPAIPQMVGSVDTPGEANAVGLYGSYCLIADGWNGLAVIDISNLSVPILVTNLNVSYAYDLDISGHTAIVTGSYLASGYSTTIVDLTDPTMPITRTTLPSTQPPQGVQVAGNLAYIAGYSSGIQIVDVSNPDQPELAGELNYPRFGADQIARWGHQAVVADNNRLQLVDFSNPSQLKPIGTIELGDNYVREMTSLNGLVVAQIYNASQLIVYDLAADNHDTPLAAFPRDTANYEQFTGMTSQGSLLIGGTAKGHLELIDFSSPTNSKTLASTGVFGQYTPPGCGAAPSPLSVSMFPTFHNNVAYVGGYTGASIGTYIVELRSPQSLRPVGLLSNDQLLVDMQFEDGLGFALMYRISGPNFVKEIIAYNLSTPTAPTIISTFPLETVPLPTGITSFPCGWKPLIPLPLQLHAGMALESNQLIIPSPETSELIHLDVSDPASMQLVERVPTAGVPGDAFSVASHIFAAETEVVLESFRLDSSSPLDAPVIFQQPGDQTLGTGQRLLLQVGALGTNDLSFQWFQNQHPIPDATNSWFKVDPVVANQTGLYHVTVSDGVHLLKSETATVTVFPGLATSTLAARTLSGRNNGANLQVVGDFAYLVDGNFGLLIYNVSNPAEPILVGQLQIAGSSSDLEVIGDLVAIANGIAGVQIVDVSVPADPQLVGVYNPGEYIWETGRVGSDLVVAAGAQGIQIVSLSDATQPTKIGEYPDITDANDFENRGDYLFVANGMNGLVILNAANRSSPTMIGATAPGFSANGVALSGDYALLSVYNTGMYVINIHDLANPTVLGTYTDGRNLPAYDVAAVGTGGALLSLFQEGVHVIDLGDFEFPSLRQVISGMFYPNIETSGNLAFLAARSEGMKIYDLSNQPSPQLLGAAPDYGYSGEAAVDGNHLFSISESGRVDIYDVTDPSDPSVIGTIDTGESLGWQHMIVADNKVYLGAGTAGLLVYDVSTPAAPTFAGSYQVPGFRLDQFEIRDGIGYLGFNKSGIHIVDLANPGTPVLLTNLVQTIDQTFSLAVVGNTLLYAYPYKLRRVDISNPATPLPLEDLEVPVSDYRLNHLENSLYLLWDGIYPVDLTDPSKPGIGFGLALPGSPLDLAQIGRFGLVTMSNGEIALLDLIDPLLPRLLSTCPAPINSFFLTSVGRNLYANQSSYGFSLLGLGLPDESISPVLGIEMNQGTPSVTVQGERNQLIDLEEATHLGPERNWHKVGHFIQPGMPITWSTSDNPGSHYFYRARSAE